MKSLYTTQNTTKDKTKDFFRNILKKELRYINTVQSFSSILRSNIIAQVGAGNIFVDLIFHS